MTKTTATPQATRTATAAATTSATHRIIATATGRSLVIRDTQNNAEVHMTINAQGGLERTLTNATGHDKQYGNNICSAIAYTVPNLMNKKAGVAKNLQTLAKTINAIPARNIRNLSNRLRKTLNTQYSLVSPYAEDYATCAPEVKGFFHEISA